MAGGGARQRGVVKRSASMAPDVPMQQHLLLALICPLTLADSSPCMSSLAADAGAASSAAASAAVSSAPGSRPAARRGISRSPCTVRWRLVALDAHTHVVGRSDGCRRCARACRALSELRACWRKRASTHNTLCLGQWRVTRVWRRCGAAPGSGPCARFRQHQAPVPGTCPRTKVPPEHFTEAASIPAGAWLVCTLQSYMEPTGGAKIRSSASGAC